MSNSSQPDLSPSEQEFIRDAFSFLERPNFLVRLANAVGRPVEMALEALPAKSQALIHNASEKALRKGLELVTKTLGEKSEVVRGLDETLKSTRLTGRLHALATFGLGASGGFFGLMSLPVELPLTTSVMLRSIASIAQEFGMDLSDRDVQLECLYILSLGSTREGEPHRSAYWTSRAIFTKTLRNDVVKFVAMVAAKFEVVVTEKVAAEALPVIGAVGGGTINAAFTEYFSQAARYHFGLRALENRHGRKTVEDYYQNHMRIP